MNISVGYAAIGEHIARVMTLDGNDRTIPTMITIDSFISNQTSCLTNKYVYNINLPVLKLKSQVINLFMITYSIS